MKKTLLVGLFSLLCVYENSTASNIDMSKHWQVFDKYSIITHPMTACLHNDSDIVRKMLPPRIKADVDINSLINAKQEEMQRIEAQIAAAFIDEKKFSTKEELAKYESVRMQMWDIRAQSHKIELEKISYENSVLTEILSKEEILQTLKALCNGEYDPDELRLDASFDAFFGECDCEDDEGNYKRYLSIFEGRYYVNELLGLQDDASSYGPDSSFDFNLDTTLPSINRNLREEYASNAGKMLNGLDQYPLIRLVPRWSDKKEKGEPLEIEEKKLKKLLEERSAKRRALEDRQNELKQEIKDLKKLRDAHYDKNGCIIEKNCRPFLKQERRKLPWNWHSCLFSSTVKQDQNRVKSWINTLLFPFEGDLGDPVLLFDKLEALDRLREVSEYVLEAKAEIKRLARRRANEAMYYNQGEEIDEKEEIKIMEELETEEYLQNGRKTVQYMPKEEIGCGNDVRKRRNGRIREITEKTVKEEVANLKKDAEAFGDMLVEEDIIELNVMKMGCLFLRKHEKHEQLQAYKIVCKDYEADRQNLKQQYDDKKSLLVLQYQEELKSDPDNRWILWKYANIHTAMQWIYDRKSSQIQFKFDVATTGIHFGEGLGSKLLDQVSNVETLGYNGIFFPYSVVVNTVFPPLGSSIDNTVHILLELFMASQKKLNLFGDGATSTVVFSEKDWNTLVDIRGFSRKFFESFFARLHAQISRSRDMLRDDAILDKVARFRESSPFFQLRLIFDDCIVCCADIFSDFWAKIGDMRKNLKTIIGQYIALSNERSSNVKQNEKTEENYDQDSE